MNSTTPYIMCTVWHIINGAFDPPTKIHLGAHAEDYSTVCVDLSFAMHKRNNGNGLKHRVILLTAEKIVQCSFIRVWISYYTCVYFLRNNTQVLLCENGCVYMRIECWGFHTSVVISFTVYESMLTGTTTHSTELHSKSISEYVCASRHGSLKLPSVTSCSILCSEKKSLLGVTALPCRPWICSIKVTQQSTNSLCHSLQKKKTMIRKKKLHVDKFLGV